MGCFRGSKNGKKGVKKAYFWGSAGGKKELKNSLFSPDLAPGKDIVLKVFALGVPQGIFFAYHRNWGPQKKATVGLMVYGGSKIRVLVLLCP